MTIFVLDNEALVRRIDLCLRRSERAGDIRIVVPDVALQLFDTPRLALLHSTMLAAMKENAIEIAAVDLEPDLRAERAANLSRVQHAVARFACALAKPASSVVDADAVHDQIVVVTVHRDLVAYCKNAGLETLSPTEAVKQLPLVRGNLLRLLWTGIRQITSESLRSTLYGVTLTAALLVALFLVIDTRDRIWDFLQAQPLVAAAVCLLGALYAFWVRARHRLIYAVIEISIGVVLVVLTVFHHSIGNNLQDGLLKAAGGVYVIVRGLDNLGKALMGTRLGLLWWRVFGD